MQLDHLLPLRSAAPKLKKELFSIAFSIEGFEGYFYGKKVFIQTDHKPLESIMFKSLLTAHKRL